MKHQTPTAPLSEDRYLGCVLGLAAGDALGAPYEGGIAERAVWGLMGTTRGGARRWTDDTQMTVDLAESILENGGLELDAVANRFAASYRWSRGYGPGTARVLKRIHRGESWESATRAVYPDGSYGNGAAMRSTVLALFYPDDAVELEGAARASAAVTHGHPVGVDGAALMACVARGLLHGQDLDTVLEEARRCATTPQLIGPLEVASDWLRDGAVVGPKEAAKQLGNGMTVPTSCPSALYLGLSHRDRSFAELIRFAADCGGDVDTIGAMAGSLWGVANGVPELADESIEAWDDLGALARRIYRFVIEARGNLSAPGVSNRP